MHSYHNSSKTIKKVQGSTIKHSDTDIACGIYIFTGDDDIAGA